MDKEKRANTGEGYSPLLKMQDQLGEFVNNSASER